MTESEEKCFKVMTLKEKQDELENKNRANRAFRLFLREAGAPIEEYQFFEEDEVANWLSKFWHRARTTEDEYYTVNSLKSFKYVINSHTQHLCDVQIYILLVHFTCVHDGG